MENAIGLIIEYQNYQQVRTVLNKEEEDRDLFQRIWALNSRIFITFEPNNFRWIYLNI